MRLSQLASAMLNALRSLTKDSILICDNSSDINFDTMLNKTILLFASSQSITSMTRKPQQFTQSFILEEDKNKGDQLGHYTNSEDLIFQLADELYRYYNWESNEDLRSGDTSMANEKKELANQIHKELKKVHQRFSVDENDDKPPICTITTIVWLKSNYDNDDVMTKIENLFKDLVSSFPIFYDEQECFSYVCTTEYNNSVFIIIDNDYKDISVLGFRQLNNVKQIYRYDQSLSTKEATNGNRDYLCVRLTHDLISHYNELGNQFEERKDSNNAKDMFLKARDLCELLIKLCKT
jgi:hypothetical protein